MKIVCQQTILMKYHALFLKKQQNLKLSSAVNYRWRFKGLIWSWTTTSWTVQTYDTYDILLRNYEDMQT